MGFTLETDPDVIERLKQQSAKPLEDQATIDRLNKQRGIQPEAGQREPLKMPAVTGAREALGGATLGFADEIQAVIAATVAAPFVSDKTFGQLMVDARESLRDESGQFRDENPGTALALNVAGGLATGGAAIQGLKTAGVAVTGAKGALATGATLGAAGGVGTAEEGSRIEGALKGAAAGLLIGGTISGVAGAGRAIWRKLAPGVQNRFAALARASDLTPQEIQTRLRALGPKAVIADVHDVFQRAADVAASRIGTTAKRVKELIRRDEGQFGRLMVPIKRLFGEAEQGAATIGQLKAIKEEIASPLYEKAFATVVQPTPRLKDLLSRPVTQAAWKSAQKLGKSDPDVDVAALSEGVDPSFRGWQAITERIGDQIGKLLRDGKPKAAGTLIRLKKAIYKELDMQGLNEAERKAGVVSDYARARAIWSGTDRADDMLAEGAKFFNRSPGQVKEAMLDMTEGDKSFYRLGIGQAIEERLAKSNDTTDLARLFKNQAFRSKAMAVFPTKESAVDFINTVRAEGIKKTTTNLVGRGSQTQPRQVAEKQMSGHSIDTEVTSVTGAARKSIKGIGATREKTIQEIGELLLSPDPTDHQRALALLQVAREAQASVGPASAAGASLAGQQAGR